MNFLVKAIFVFVFFFLAASYVAYDKNRPSVGEVTLNDLGDTAKKGAEEIRHYLINESKDDAKKVYDKAKEVVKWFLIIHAQYSFM